MTEPDHINAFLSYIRDCETCLHIACADEQETNDQTQDILHRLELQVDDYRMTAKLGKLLREVRKRRRAAKDARERLSAIDEWAARNQEAIKGLERLLGEHCPRSRRAAVHSNSGQDCRSASGDLWLGAALLSGVQITK